MCIRDSVEDGPLTPMVIPPSGSTFPLGDTTVNVSATDANGAVTTGSFVVSVRFQRPAETTVTVSAHSGEAAPGAGTGGLPADAVLKLSLIHISEPTRLLSISYAVFCLKK